MNYRNPRLLALAKGQACQLCGKQDGSIVSAHSNQAIHGKGLGIKAHDVFAICWLCLNCHVRIDSGPEDRAVKQGLWRTAHDRTLLEMFKQGLIEVKK